MSGHERVESQGCPHRAGREVIAWGRSRGLSRFRCKGCGRTFNALTKTSMAHLPQKAALARPRPGDDRRQKPVQDRRALRRASDDSLSLPSPTRPSSSNPPRAGGPLCRVLRRDKRGGSARHLGTYQDNIPVLAARDRRGATFFALKACTARTDDAQCRRLIPSRREEAHFGRRQGEWAKIHPPLAPIVHVARWPLLQKQVVVQILRFGGSRRAL
jgi:hypothetical protein